MFLLPMQIQESRVLILRDQGKQQVGFHKFYNLKCLNFAFTELVHHMLSEVTTKLMKQSVVSCNMLFNKRLMRDINRSKLKIALRQDNFPSKPIPELPYNSLIEVTELRILSCFCILMSPWIKSVSYSLGFRRILPCSLFRF